MGGHGAIAVPISMTLQMIHCNNYQPNYVCQPRKPEAKGIHMSRLHLALNKLADRECNQANIDDFWGNGQFSEGISQNAKIELSFDLLLRKPALLSGEIGFQTYPVVLRAERHEAQLSCELEVTIPYSSTCLVPLHWHDNFMPMPLISNSWFNGGKGWVDGGTVPSRFCRYTSVRDPMPI